MQAFAVAAVVLLTPPHMRAVEPTKHGTLIDL